MPDETEKPIDEETHSEDSLITPPDEDPDELEQPDDIELGRAVNDIEKEESSEVLAAEDKQQAAKAEDKTRWYKKKRIWIPAVIVVILAAIFGVPKTRYLILGYVLKESYSVTVMDSATHQPVSEATVSLGDTSAQTNNNGQATFHTRVGTTKLSVSKKYYNNFSGNVLVGVFSKNNQNNISFVASGRQVPITIINKITNKPIENATISASGTAAKTDSAGMVTVVLPATEKSVAATISADGYNSLSASTVVTTQQVPSNMYALVPSGKVYFLSNASGKIDVVKTDLDGTNSQTVLAGTGQEDPNDTLLSESTDGKYLALISKRSGDYASLFIISTADNSLVTADSGSANFTLIGWTSNDYLVYQVDRQTYAFGQPGKSALKSFDAETSQLYQLDSTAGSGSNTTDSYEEYYASVNILADNTIVYAKGWNGTQGTNAAVTIATIQANSGNKQTVKTFSIPPYTGYPQGIEASPSSVLYNIATIDNSGNSTNMYFLYQNGALTDQTSNSTLVTPLYGNQGKLAQSNFLLSPSEQNTAWNTPVNGHSAIYVGDLSGNGKQVALLDNTYGLYGWLTNNYLLVEKNQNELYIMPTNGLSDQSQLVKIGNYLN